MSLLRSLLFAPANRLDLLRKFPRCSADAYAIDLEDGTPAEEKERARSGLGAIVDELRSVGLCAPLYVRINAPRTPQAELDLAAALAAPIDGIVVPKLGARADVRAVEATLARAEDRTGRTLRAIGLIETAVGVVNVDRLAGYWRARLAAIAFGAEDFVTDVGGRRRSDNAEVLYARSRVVLSARAHGIAALDQVFAQVRDAEGFTRDAQFARDLGYTGKLCITPQQAELANEAFSPSADEVERSLRLIRAYRDAKSAGRGTIELEGALVDEPMLRRAEAIVAWANPSNGAESS
jgi:citrate lyase subunit beta / citryl-CoA lyase